MGTTTDLTAEQQTEFEAMIADGVKAEIIDRVHDECIMGFLPYLALKLHPELRKLFKDPDYPEKKLRHD